MSDPFIDTLLQELRIGYGFVPLVGSGLSAPSGIPVGVDFGNYILSYIYKITEGADAWSPTDPMWPQLDEIHNSRMTAEQKRRTVRAWLDIWEREKDESNGVALEAIGSLANWRAALTFLSRLPEAKKCTAEFLKGLELRAPNDTVVDSAFIHVTRDRQPTLAHMMLAHCADPLRVQTILTTNFDTLIEEAFQRQGIYLTTFDVHHHAGLPTGQLVLAQRSIVKLHGGRYGLRADYSLDEDPSEHDKKTFADYFAARRAAADDGTNRKHLLVMGVSGADSRTMKLVKHAAAETHNNLRVFWVFHRRPHRDNLAAIKRATGVPDDRFHWTVQADLGLMMLNLYQRHYLSLPPSGADFATQTLFPPDNYPEAKYDKSKLEDAIERLKSGIATAEHYRAAEHEAGKPHPSLIVVHGGGGVSSAASRVYDDLLSEYNAIWLELDQYADVVDFLIALADAVVQKLGTTMVTPPVSDTNVDRCLQRLVSLVAASQRPFLVFANGREKPGSSTDWEGKAWEKKEENEFWKQMKRLIELLPPKSLHLVALAGNDGLKLPRQKSRWTVIECDALLRFDLAAVCAAINQSKPEEWSKEHQRFVFAMTLFRKSRYPAALTTWGLLKATKRLSNNFDNDEDRAKKCDEYLRILTEFDAIRRQPGGMVWMHADIRKNLYHRLRRIERVCDEEGSRRIERVCDEEATCHQGIADWYVKLFRSSSDPHAALESIYHRIHCAESARSSIQGRDKRSEDRMPADVVDCDVKDLEVGSLIEAIETLELARDRILATARSRTTVNTLTQLIDRILEKQQSASGTVYGDHAELWRKLSVVCEDILCDFSRTRGGEFRPRRQTRPMSKLKQAPNNLPISRRQDADGLLHERKYARCEREFEELFKELQIPPMNFDSTKGDFIDLVSKMRGDAKQWCQQSRSDEEMKLAVRGLRGYMFLQILISHVAKLCCEKSVGGQDDQTNECYLRLRYAESIYTLATSVTRYITDHDFLQLENTYIRTHYGVLLADLKRFKEGHRRLNEATGYLSKSSKATNGLAWAVIDLRRAETYLFQARSALEGPAGCCTDSLVQDFYGRAHEAKEADRQRSAGAFLDDMRYALERARARFVNHRKDVWWWTLLLELQLAYFDERCRQRQLISSDEVPLSVRDVTECVDLVNKALLMFHSDGVRFARMLDLLMSIERRIGTKDPEAAKKLNDKAVEVSKRLKEYRKGIEGDLKVYVDAVAVEFRKSAQRHRALS
jgi:hypothetical protein